MVDFTDEHSLGLYAFGAPKLSDLVPRLKKINEQVEDNNRPARNAAGKAFGKVLEDKTARNVIEKQLAADPQLADDIVRLATDHPEYTRDSMQKLAAHPEQLRQIVDTGLNPPAPTSKPAPVAGSLLRTSFVANTAAPVESSQQALRNVFGEVLEDDDAREIIEKQLVADPQLADDMMKLATEHPEYARNSTQKLIDHPEQLKQIVAAGLNPSAPAPVVGDVLKTAAPEVTETSPPQAEPPPPQMEMVYSLLIKGAMGVESGSNPSLEADIDGFAKNMVKYPALENAVKSGMEGDDPKSLKTQQILQDQFKKDPKMFEKINDFIRKNPDQVDTMAQKFSDDPQAAMGMLNMASMASGAAGWFREHMGGPGMLGSIGNFIADIIEGLPGFLGSVGGFFSEMMGPIKDLLGMGDEDPKDDGKKKNEKTADKTAENAPKPEEPAKEKTAEVEKPDIAAEVSVDESPDVAVTKDKAETPKIDNVSAAQDRQHCEGANCKPIPNSFGSSEVDLNGGSVLKAVFDPSARGDAPSPDPTVRKDLENTDDYTRQDPRITTSMEI